MTDTNDFENQLYSQFEDSSPSQETDEGQPGPPPPAAAPTPSRVKLTDDLELPPDHAQVLADFYKWLQANPQQAALIDAYLSGQAEIVRREQPQAPEPQPAPQPKAQDEQKEPPSPELAELEQLRQKIAQLEQIQYREQMQTAHAAVVEGQQRFAKRMGLTDEELEKVSQVAAAIGSLPHFVQAAGDMITGVEQALENAFWTIPEMREKAISQMLSSPDLARQRRAASISGSGGSAPRQSPPTTPEDRRKAMIDEITQALRGGLNGS